MCALIDLNHLEELNSEICQAYQDAPARLIRYALDTQYLPDDVYDSFPASVLAVVNDSNNTYTLEPLLKRLRYLFKLYWIRLFFEDGRGDNYSKLLRQKFERITYSNTTDLLGEEPKVAPGFDHLQPKHRFLYECWAISGRENGETSEVLRWLLTMVRSLPNNCIKEIAFDVLDDLAEREPLPQYLETLIERRDRDFIDSVLALDSQAGNGWLANFVQISQDHAGHSSASVSWKLNWNGSNLNPLLEIGNIHLVDSSAVLSVNKKIERSITSGTQSLYFRPEELVDAGIDIDSVLTVRIANRKVAELPTSENYSSIFLTEKPAVFRCLTGLLPPLKPNSHVTAKRIAVLWPDGVRNGQELNHDGTPLQAIKRATVCIDGKQRHVEAFEFPAATGTPADLCWQGISILTVGSQPYIHVENEATDVQLIDRPGTCAVFGDTASISLKNRLLDGLEWEIDGQKQADASPKQIQRKYGETVQVKCDGAKVKILFLPPEESLPEGWKLEDSGEISEKIIAAAGGYKLQRYTFSDGNHCDFKKSLTETVWWWQKSAIGEPEGFNEAKQFSDHSELGPWLLHTWVCGNGALPITLGQNTLDTASQGMSSRFIANQLSGIQNFAGIGNVEALSVDNQAVANVLNAPDHAVLLKDGEQANVYFPANATPNSFRVMRLSERSFVKEDVEVISCAGFDTGQQVPVEFQSERDGCEEVWACLVEMTGDGMPDFWDIINGSRRLTVRSCVCLQQAGTDALVQRLGVEQGSENAKQVSAVLEIVSGQSSPLKRWNAFSKAISEKHFLNVNPAKEAMNKYFRSNCSTVPLAGEEESPLEKSLQFMLDAGFNWIAEPQWIAGSLIVIKDGQCNINGQAKPWRTITGGRWLILQAQHPLLRPLYDIANKDLPRDYIEDLLVPRYTIGLRYLNIAMQGVCVNRIALNNVGNKVASIKTNPADTNEILRRETLWFADYHSSMKSNITLPNNTVHSVAGWLPEDKDEAFLNFMLDGQALAEEPILSPEERDRLFCVFNSTVDLCENLLGSMKDRGLGYMFRIACNAFRRWEYDVRSEIFQAAVLCRLHAWYGWGGWAKPENWPLDDTNNYRLLCKVAANAWNDETLRNVFLEDLVPVEWMLAVFHN